MKVERISIIGDGGFGWAWAFVLALAGHEVVIYTRKPVQRYNYPYDWMQRYPKPDNIEVKQLILAPDTRTGELLFIATPASSFLEVLERVRSLEYGGKPYLVTLTKGLYGGHTPCQLIENILPGWHSGHITGAAFSEDLVDAAHRGLPMHMVVASTNKSVSSKLELLLEPTIIQPVWCEHTSRVQLAFALRPVVSFMQGIASGYVDRHSELRPLLPIIMSKMINEGHAIAVTLGGYCMNASSAPADVLLADHLLCMNKASRNFESGWAGGYYAEMAEFKSGRGVVESLNTIKHLYGDLLVKMQHEVISEPEKALARRFPYFAAAYAFLEQGVGLEDCVRAILDRSSGPTVRPRSR